MQLSIHIKKTLIVSLEPDHVRGQTVSSSHPFLARI